MLTRQIAVKRCATGYSVRYNLRSMTRLRRIATRDRIFFVTTDVDGDVDPFLPAERSMILDVVDQQHRRESFWLFGYVVMPDHLHLLLSPASVDLPRIMRDIKSVTGYRLAQSRCAALHHGSAAHHGSVAHLYRGEALKDDARLPHSFKCGVSGSLPKGIWQRRYFDVIIRHVRDFWNKLEYIHQNPVAARLVKRPDDWPWSSYAAYTKSTQPPICRSD